MVQLTLIQFFRQTRIPGHLFRGKKRLVERVTPAKLRKLEREYDLQMEVRKSRRNLLNRLNSTSSYHSSFSEYEIPYEPVSVCGKILFNQFQSSVFSITFIHVLWIFIILGTIAWPCQRLAEITSKD